MTVDHPGPSYEAVKSDGAAQIPAEDAVVMVERFLDQSEHLYDRELDAARVA